MSIDTTSARAAAPIETGMAVRSDRVTGAREEAGFFGPVGDQRFGCRHVPAGSPAGGLVVCSPIHEEFAQNYRREVLLGRALAARGMAVQRFHPRGFGNSDGDDGFAPTMETMAEDADAATDVLRQATGVSRVGYLGSRWGGLVAAGAAGRVPGAPLALWEPAVDADRYLGGAFRARAIRDLREGQTEPPSNAALRSRLEETGSLDVLGYELGWPLVASASGRTLVDELGPAPRPLLLVQIGRTRGLRGELAAMVARWESLGWAVRVEILAGEETWWFTDSGWVREESRESSIRLIDLTAEWIGAALTGSA